MMRSFSALGALLLGFALVGFLSARGYMHAPIPELSEARVYQLEAGQSLQGVVAELAAEGVVEWPRVFTLWARLAGVAGRLQAGEYELAAGASPDEILLQFVAGRVKLHEFTIVEGWTWIMG